MGSLKLLTILGKYKCVALFIILGCVYFFNQRPTGLKVLPIPEALYLNVGRGDFDNMFSGVRMIYTAISRARRLEQIFLI